MATNPLTLLNGTTADANDVEDKVNPLYTSIDSGNVGASNKTGTGVFVLTNSPNLTTPKLQGAGAGEATVQYANSGSNRTVTIPDPGENSDFAMAKGAQTLEAKTVIKSTSGYIDKGSSGGGTVDIDMDDANTQKVRLTGNPTFTFSNPQNFQRLTLILEQDGSGNRTVTWPTTVRWLNGTGATNSTTDKPTLTTTANKTDVISFYYDSDDSLWIGSVVGYKGAQS